MYDLTFQTMPPHSMPACVTPRATPNSRKGALNEKVISCFLRQAARFRSGLTAPVRAPPRSADARPPGEPVLGASPSFAVRGRRALKAQKTHRHFRGGVPGPVSAPPRLSGPRDTRFRALWAKTFFKIRKKTIKCTRKKLPAARTHLPCQQRVPCATKIMPARSSLVQGRPEEAGQAHATRDQITHLRHLSTRTGDRARRRASSRGTRSNSPSRAQQHCCCAPFLRAYRHARSS